MYIFVYREGKVENAGKICDGIVLHLLPFPCNYTLAHMRLFARAVALSYVHCLSTLSNASFRCKARVGKKSPTLCIAQQIVTEICCVQRKNFSVFVGIPLFYHRYSFVTQIDIQMHHMKIFCSFEYSPSFIHSLRN